MLDRKRKRTKSPETKSPLPSFTTCPMCNEVSPSEDVTTEVVLDGKPVKVCESCAWTLGVGVGRLDE